MNINQNSLITLALVSSITLIGVVALIRNTPATLEVNLGEDKSFTLEGREPLPIPNPKNNCLPGEENSQFCD